MAGPTTTTPGAEDEQPLQRQNEKEAKAVFLPEERAPRLTWQQQLAKKLKIRNEYVRLFLAEFIGTFVLCSIGIGCVAQAELSKRYGLKHGEPSYRIPDGNIVTIAMGWGLAVAMGVYSCGGVSGGHINPAVTTAMVLLGRLPVRKMPFYMLGQYLGAWFASLCVFVVYIEGLNNYEVNRSIDTAGIWSTYPKAHVSIWEGFADQIFATCLLVLIIMAITDEQNMAVQKGLIPFVIGFGVTAILFSFATNCGGALNPARDLAPRIFTSMAGWGKDPFSFRSGSWFWVPIVGPHIGAVLGALLYNICVGLHWPEPDVNKNLIKE